MKIKITDTKIRFSSDNQKDWEITYKQVGTGFKNNSSYKQIKFDNQTYSFIFPDKKDKNNVVIIVPYNDDNLMNGDVYWVLSKKEYSSYKKYK